MESTRIENSGYKNKSYEIFEKKGMRFLFEKQCKSFFVKEVEHEGLWGKRYTHYQVYVSWGQCSTPSSGDYEWVEPVGFRTFSNNNFEEFESAANQLLRNRLRSFTENGLGYSLEEFVGNLELGMDKGDEQNWSIGVSKFGYIFGGNFKSYSGAFRIHIYKKRVLDNLLSWIERKGIVCEIEDNII